MNTIDWNKLAEQSANKTDKEFNQILSTLTHLKMSEVEEFIKLSKISNENASKVLHVIYNATASNEQKTQAITSIENGVNFLIHIASKIL